MSRYKNNKFTFDKFVKDICKREDQGIERIKMFQEEVEENPKRKYNRLYREDWRNRTRVEIKK